MPTYRFGKHPPKYDYRTLRFKNYVSAELAAPPPAYDVLADVYKKLKITDPTALFPMDGNDTYGDCTIAALAHATTVYNGKVGAKKIPAPGMLEKLYFHLTGGVDSGLQELDVLNYWRKHAVDGEKILAYVKIDVHRQDYIKQAIHLFGGVYLGFQVQKSCLQDFEARKPWTPGPLTKDGHAVYAVGYDAKEVTVLTWGNTQKATWAWWDECVDEAYAILPPQAKDTDFAPGFNFAQLKSDLNAVAHV
jgi:hypothetical protein